MTEAETVPLTAEELAVYNEIFEYQVYDDEGNPVSGTGSKPINQFLTSNYSRPQDINLVRLLWYFPCDGLVTDEAEFETLKDAENWTFEGCATLDRVPVPIHRTSADSVNKALVKYMGISLEDHSGVGTEKLTYLKAADSYYTYASDCSGACFIAVSGERQGELVRLYSENAVLTLMLQGDRFLFVSHLLTGEPSESGLTLTDITESSSVICMGKIIDGRAVDKNMKAFNIAVTSELKGAAEGTRIEIHTQKSFQAGSIYIFFLAKGKDSIEYDLLSIASYNEHDGKISYDEALILDVGYENIDKIDELYEYIQR